MRNLGKVLMDGVDLSSSMSLPVGKGYVLRADASYSFLRAVDVSDRTAKNHGHQIQYTPRNSGAVEWSVSKEGMGISYTLCAVGKRWFLPQNREANELKPYFDQTIALHRDFLVRGRKLSVGGEILNVTGDNYEIVHGYPMPGRQFRLTLKISYP